ncbi:MAG: DNA repair protein RecO [Candidatus Delongbacteria bacterium]|nr:DNA repair protein RecO [Candidatus Delongbacteria bacterium]
MPYLRSEAIILRSTHFQDTGKILNCLTRDHGLVAVLAKGARSPKSKFMGNLELFSHVELVYAYKETRQIQTLCEVNLIAFHQGILIDLDKLALVGQIGWILNRCLMECKPLPELFSELLKVMTLVDYCENSSQQELAYLYFLNAFLKTGGWGLNFNQCSRCGTPFGQEAVLDWNGSALYCIKCRPDHYRYRRISQTEMQILARLDIPSILTAPRVAQPIYLSLLDIFRQLYQHHLNLLISNFQSKE